MVQQDEVNPSPCTCWLSTVCQDINKHHLRKKEDLKISLTISVLLFARLQNIKIKIILEICQDNHYVPDFLEMLYIHSLLDFKSWFSNCPHGNRILKWCFRGHWEARRFIGWASVFGHPNFTQKKYLKIWGLFIDLFCRYWVS